MNDEPERPKPAEPPPESAPPDSPFVDPPMEEVQKGLNPFEREGRDNDE
jgi:hypothetical protein